MKTSVFGSSAQGLPIAAFRHEGGGPELLMLGGVHGDEPEGVACAWGVWQAILEGAELRANLTIVPQFNADGVLAKSRLNGHGVDLNRNLPSNDWNPKAFNDRYPPGPRAGSEPENQALIAWLSRARPKFILSAHSWKPMLNTNGECRLEAEAIRKLTGYAIEPTVGYPTPGSLGTYAGVERSMPTLTYEIERGLAIAEVLRIHVPAALAGLRAASAAL